MQVTDRGEFESRLKLLCAGFNVPVTTERVEAYWLGLAKMPLSSFVRATEHALGEGGPEKIPTPRQCWAISKTVRHSQPKVEPTPLETREAEAQRLGYDPADEWELLANRIGMKFSRCFGGNHGRSMEGWRALRRIAQQFSMLAVDEDPEATGARMQSAIIQEFRRIAEVASREGESKGRGNL